MSKSEIKEGLIFRFAYPFTHGSYSERDEDGIAEITTWKPGVDLTATRDGNAEPIAEGMGEQIVEVIGTFKPGKYPLRVFFTRKWKDPDGKVFGNAKLRILSLTAFRSRLNGYRYEFKLADAPTRSKNQIEAVRRTRD